MAQTEGLLRSVWLRLKLNPKLLPFRLRSKIVPFTLRAGSQVMHPRVKYLGPGDIGLCNHDQRQREKGASHRQRERVAHVRGVYRKDAFQTAIPTFSGMEKDFH